MVQDLCKNCQLPKSSDKKPPKQPENVQCSGPLYCLTRLVQQSSLRTNVLKAMLVELQRRFAYHRVFAVPSRATNSRNFRRSLARLLWEPWDPSRQVTIGEASARQSEKMVNWQNVFAFFNGNLQDEDNWEHWCTGCCSDRDTSLEKAGSSSTACSLVG